MNMKLGVLGAGIVGVNTALILQEHFPNAEIHIIADKFNQDTLSNGAAGIFRPSSNFHGPNETITRKWIVDSYNHYDNLYKTEEAAFAGIMQVSGYGLSSKYKEITQNTYLEKLLPVYRNVTPRELEICPGSWKYGCYFTTFVISSSHYLPWAIERFQRQGGQVHHESINDLKDAASIYDILVNCSGMNAKFLCHDQKLIPIRGQVYKVKAPWIKMFYYGDFDTYVIPGMNYVTMGGCRNYESYNENVDKHDSASIWERCTSLVPSLQKAEVVKEWVGLRPHRDPVRVEKEVIQNEDKVLKIVHNYGHGSYGVTTSPGTSKYAVELVKEMLGGYVQNYNSKL